MEKKIMECLNNKRFIGEELVIELEAYLINDISYTIDEVNNILMAVNQYNNQLRHQMVKDNKKMKELLSNRSNETMTIEPIEEVKNSKSSIKNEQDLSMNLDVSFYLELLKNSNTYEDIVDILPDKQTDNYLDIINTILVYYYGELITIQAMLKEDNDEDLIKDRENYQKKIGLIKKYCKDLNNSQIKLHKNETKLIFLKTSGDNVCILSDIERDIEPDFYSDIKELLVCLKNGIFKNVKCFSDNKDLSGLSEVKYHKARITFKRLSNNTYIVLHGFIKKWSNNSHYRNFLKERYSLYKNQSSKIDQYITDGKYIQENNEIYNQIIGTLNKEKRGEGNAKVKRRS